MVNGAKVDLRLTVSEASRVKLPRHAQLRFDEPRGIWVILVPERVLVPDQMSVEIIQLCDGRSVGEIVDSLAKKYAAGRETISADVIAMFQDLADKGFLEEAAEKK
jgi:pyrroloquinoline quinone biosynthesis protein D